MNTTPRAWSWPDPIISIRQLLALLRNGFSLVRLPMLEGSAASATPAYRLRREGQDSPANVLGGAIAHQAITRGLVGHGIKLADGAMLFKLTTRAPSAAPDTPND